jgi:hypothetical protein
VCLHFSWCKNKTNFSEIIKICRFFYKKLHFGNKNTANSHILRIFYSLNLLSDFLKLMFRMLSRYKKIKEDSRFPAAIINLPENPPRFAENPPRFRQNVAGFNESVPRFMPQRLTFVFVSSFHIIVIRTFQPSLPSLPSPPQVTEVTEVRVVSCDSQLYTTGSHPGHRQ